MSFSPFLTAHAVWVLSVVWSRYSICLWDCFFCLPVAAAATASSSSHFCRGLPTSHAPVEYNLAVEVSLLFLERSGELFLLLDLEPAGLDEADSLPPINSKFCLLSCVCNGDHLSTPNITRVLVTSITGIGNSGRCNVLAEDVKEVVSSFSGTFLLLTLNWSSNCCVYQLYKYRNSISSH